MLIIMSHALLQSTHLEAEILKGELPLTVEGPAFT